MCYVWAYQVSNGKMKCTNFFFPSRSILVEIFWFSFCISSKYHKSKEEEKCIHFWVESAGMIGIPDNDRIISLGSMQSSSTTRIRYAMWCFSRIHIILTSFIVVYCRIISYWDGGLLLCMYCNRDVVHHALTTQLRGK